MAPEPDEASGPWGEAQRAVEEFLLGGERSLRRGDVAERAGVPLEQTSRLWSALGFPRVRDDVTAFAQRLLDELREDAPREIPGRRRTAAKYRAALTSR